MSYPDPQYIDISLYTPDYPALVQAVQDSPILEEGVDYTLEDGFRVLRDQLELQQDGDKAFLVLRLTEGSGGKIASLANDGYVQIWGVFPVLGEEGEMESTVYNFSELQQLVIDDFAGFKKGRFAGS